MKKEKKNHNIHILSYLYFLQYNVPDIIKKGYNIKIQRENEKEEAALRNIHTKVFEVNNLNCLHSWDNEGHDFAHIILISPRPRSLYKRIVLGIINKKEKPNVRLFNVLYVCRFQRFS